MHDFGQQTRLVYGFEVDPISLIEGVVAWKDLRERGLAPNFKTLQHLAAQRVLLSGLEHADLPENLALLVSSMKKSEKVISKQGTRSLPSMGTAENALAKDFHEGRINERQYVGRGEAPREVRLHRQAHVLLKKMYRCPVEQTDATACKCPDGFVAQAQAAIVDILRHHGLNVPVEFIFVEGYDFDGTNDSPKRLFVAVQPPQMQRVHISRFDVRAGVDVDMVGAPEALALCTVVNTLGTATHRAGPDWLFVAASMGYELYIYFTYSMYCVCIACIICIMCIPTSA